MKDLAGTWLGLIGRARGAVDFWEVRGSGFIINFQRSTFNFQLPIVRGS